MIAHDPALAVAANARRYWWLFLIRGLFGLALGVYALLFPGATLAVAVLFIGAYLIVDGVIACAKAIQIMRSDAHWWILLLEGILGIVVGLAIFMWPALSVLTLAYLVGYWAIFSGIASIVAALRLRSHIANEWLYLFFGVISVLFGLFVLFAPAAGLVYIVLSICIYGFVIGFTMIALAFRARSLPASAINPTPAR
jgi:uncharacterized membrane protein HdeD (DUF308 family)